MEYSFYVSFWLEKNQKNFYLFDIKIVAINLLQKQFSQKNYTKLTMFL